MIVVNFIRIIKNLWYDGWTDPPLRDNRIIRSEKKK
jgi:hypothetical protein